MPHIIDSSIRGRVNAWIDPIMMASQSIALGLVAVLYPKLISIEAAYMGVGVCVLAVALLYAARLPKLARSYGGWRAGMEAAPGASLERTEARHADM
ncbi:hypothetical protein D3C75_1207970 [compost metagenome]